jgi:CRISPR type III-A-associated RAMP protein Csm5
MILNLRTLTPLHVGDGSQLHAFDYTIHNGHLYRTSQQFFERFLEKLGGDAADRFAEWSGDMVDQMAELEEARKGDSHRGKDFNQRLSELRRNHNLREFAKKIGQERAFLEFIQAEKLPSLPLQPIDKSEKEKQEIRGFQRTAEGKAFVPGSTVKGSIRTALLYHFLEKMHRHEEVSRILTESVREIKREKQEAEKRKYRFSATRYAKSFAEELEYLVFFAGMIDERGKKRTGEAQDDLMRCVLVSDTAPLPHEALGIENIDLYLVKKQRGGGFAAIKQPQAPAVEAVLPGKPVSVQLEFNAEFLLHLHHQEGDEGMRIGRETHFIGWRKRAEVIFNLSKDDFDAVLNGKSTAKDLSEKAIAHILACCNRFCQSQAEALARWQKHFEAHADGDMVRGLKAGTTPVFSATGTRLHFGFATGFEGMTAVLHLLAHHKSLFADIMEIFSIGDSPSAWKNRRPGETYRPNPDRFPTSRRLATRMGYILPLGWLEWADDPKAGPPVELPAAAMAPTGISAPQQPKVPVGPQYLRGKLKPGAQVDAELIAEGNPGKFKLFIQPDFEPVVEVKYAAGFKQQDIGRLASIKINDVKKSEVIVAVSFLGFKN